MKRIEKNEITEYLPHRGKMFLVDTILDYDTKAWTISSQTAVTRDFMFFDGEAQGVPNYALFEVAAQTISSLTGIYAKENNLPVNMGLILTVSKFHFDKNIVPEGTNVLVQAERESTVGNVYAFNVNLSADEEPLGQGKLTVMEITGEEAAKITAN